MYKWKELNTKNNDYNPRKIKLFNMLYQGGYDILNPDSQSLFIPMEPGELNHIYFNRMKYSRYDNYFAEIINRFSSQIFSKQMSILIDDDEPKPKEPLADGYKSTVNADKKKNNPPEYEEFFKNADMQKHSLPQFLRQCFINASIHGAAYICADFPKKEEMPRNRAEEIALRASQPYLYQIPFEQMIDWEVDDFGVFKWCIIKDEIRTRASLADDRDKRTIRFKHWEMKGQSAQYTTYGFVCSLSDEPADKEEAVILDQGETTFPKIPVLKLQFSKELTIGDLIGMNCANLFMRKSNLLYSQKKSLFEFPVFFQGPEIGAPGDSLPSEIQTKPNRASAVRKDLMNKGMAFAGSEDDIKYISPDGKAWEIEQEQLKQDTDEIHRVTHTMANSIAANETVRSGLSKMQDNEAQEIIITAFADFIKDFVLDLYNFISLTLNDNIKWKVIGMDSYNIPDPEQTMQKVELYGFPPSRTLKQLVWEQMATDMVEMAPDVMDDVRLEIEQGVLSIGDDEISLLPADKMAKQQADAALEVKKTEVAQKAQVPQAKKPTIPTKPKTKQIGKGNK